MTPLPFLRRGKLACASLVSLGSLAGCSEDVLRADYQLAQDNPAFVAAVRRGERQVSDIFDGPPCVLNVDSHASPLQSRSSGAPGQVAFTVVSANPVNDAMNTASCPTITNFAITVAAGGGGPIGEPLPATRLVVTAGGTTYATDAPGGYFSATITGQNQNTGAVSASFVAVATAPARPSMFVAQGSFDIH